MNSGSPPPLPVADRERGTQSQASKGWSSSGYRLSATANLCNPVPDLVLGISGAGWVESVTSTRTSRSRSETLQWQCYAESFTTTFDKTEARRWCRARRVFDFSSSCGRNHHAGSPGFVREPVYDYLC